MNDRTHLPISQLNAITKLEAGKGETPIVVNTPKPMPTSIPVTFQHDAPPKETHVRTTRLAIFNTPDGRFFIAQWYSEKDDRNKGIWARIPEFTLTQ